MILGPRLFLRSFGSFFVPPSYRTLDKTDFGASAEVLIEYHKSGILSIGFLRFFRNICKIFA